MTNYLAVFDLDGVLLDERHRTHFALARQWHNYFDPEYVEKDGVWPQGLLAYEQCVLAGFDVAYLTGRREDLRSVTRSSLKKHGFDHRAPLIMRALNHGSSNGYPLPRLKAGIMRELAYFYDGTRIRFFDDDPLVCKAVDEMASQVQGTVIDVALCTWHIKPERLVRRAIA